MSAFQTYISVTSSSGKPTKTDPKHLDTCAPFCWQRKWRPDFIDNHDDGRKVDRDRYLCSFEFVVFADLFLHVRYLVIVCVWLFIPLSLSLSWLSWISAMWIWFRVHECWDFRPLPLVRSLCHSCTKAVMEEDDDRSWSGLIACGRSVWVPRGRMAFGAVLSQGLPSCAVLSTSQVRCSCVDVSSPWTVRLLERYTLHGSSTLGAERPGGSYFSDFLSPRNAPGTVRLSARRACSECCWGGEW